MNSKEFIVIWVMGVLGLIAFNILLILALPAILETGVDVGITIGEKI